MPGTLLDAHTPEGKYPYPLFPGKEPEDYINYPNYPENSRTRQRLPLEPDPPPSKGADLFQDSRHPTDENNQATRLNGFPRCTS